MTYVMSPESIRVERWFQRPLWKEPGQSTLRPPELTALRGLALYSMIAGENRLTSQCQLKADLIVCPGQVSYPC